MLKTVEGRAQAASLPAFLATIGLVLGAADVVGQEPVDFRAKDGTRFVLIPTPGAPLVHWSVATPVGAAVDPADAPGLAEAAALASMRGTWSFGSLDAGHIGMRPDNDVLTLNGLAGRR